MYIKEVRAEKILDSRGEPTIEVFINGIKASSPSGKSKGKHETPSWHKSFQWNINAISNFHELKNLKISSFSDLSLVESKIKRKFKLKDAKQFGANALFALESAILKALAKEQKKQLWEIIPRAGKIKKIPIPIGNAIGGGLHSHNKNAPEFQEFLLIPRGKTAKENYKIMKSTYSKLKSILKAHTINDEGAWQTSFSNEKVLEILSRFKNIKIGIDVAASSFYKDGNYFYNNETVDRNFQIFFINSLIKKFNLFYIEDPLYEKDFSGFSKIKYDKAHLVVGDDLTATQITRLQKAISSRSINAMIIKPNQNGSLLELEKIFRLCKKHTIKTILSHRSGETLDDALADYAVGFGADLIKCGIATRWREIKLKRLCEIERSLKK